MKNLLMLANSGHFAARTVKATLVVLTMLALGATLWIAGTRTAEAARSGNPQVTQWITAELRPGTTVETAGKADFLAAVCEATKKHRPEGPAIVTFAVGVHSDWKKDILRSVFGCLGTDDCRLLNRVLKALSTGSDASELADLALELAPNCAASFGTGHGDDEGGGFGNPPGNSNPPPGSIGGGGGGQGNVIGICHNGMTIFVSPQGAENHLQQHAGDSLGPCQVTGITNP